MSSPKPHPVPSTRESLEEYGRGIVGGLLFALPLLYTMEVWWSGFTASPGLLAVYLGATFILLLGYNRYAGLRRDASLAEVGIDSIEELGLGLILSAATLWLLGRLSFDLASAEEGLGKVVMEAGLVAIGVSVGTAQLGGGESREEGMGDEDEHPGFLGEMVLGVCGAVLIAMNVAPTEEIVMIAEAMSYLKLTLLALASIGLASVVLFGSGFVGTGGGDDEPSAREILSGASWAWIIGLAVSALVLGFFGRFEGVAPHVALAESVVLALPASLGASAGRLLLQS